MKAGRLAQDVHFDLPELRGRRIARLVSVVDLLKADDRPIAVYVSLVDDDAWHRLFLDAGFAVWENWGRVVEDAEDGIRLVDLTSQWNVAGRSIRAARVRPHGPLGHAMLSIEFDDGARIELSYVDEQDHDSDTILRWFDAPTS